MKKKLHVVKKKLPNVKNNLHIVIMAAVFVIIALIAVLLVVSLSNSNDESEGYNPVTQTDWPDNDLTEGFPEFEGDIYSVMTAGTSTAVFAQNVEKTEADEYAAKLAASGVKFTSEDYPRTAQKGDIFITLAYNAEEKKFSITFAVKNESDVKHPEAETSD